MNCINMTGKTELEYGVIGDATLITKKNFLLKGEVIVESTDGALFV